MLCEEQVIKLDLTSQRRRKLCTPRRPREKKGKEGEVKEKVKYGNLNRFQSLTVWGKREKKKKERRGLALQLFHPKKKKRSGRKENVHYFEKKGEESVLKKRNQERSREKKAN